MKREKLVNVYRVRESGIENQGPALDENEARLVTEAMLRGLKRTGKDTFTEIDLESVVAWASRAKIRATLLAFVLDGEVDMIPNAEGDPEKVVFRARI